MCKRGFILAETIITAVFVMTLFTFFFVSIFPLSGEYERRKNYDDIDTLYAANYARDFILEYWPDSEYPVINQASNTTDVVDVNCSASFLSTEAREECSDLVEAYDITKMYLIPFSIENENAISSLSTSRDFQEYIKYMPSFTNEHQTLIYSEDYRVIVERTKNNNQTDKYYANTEIIKEIVYPQLDTSGANAPELVGDMIPIVYNGTNWVKSNLYDWYNYDIGKWANVATVSSATREYYMNAEPGTVISMNDINTMFVWIPRYSYTIQDTYGVDAFGVVNANVNTPGMIDIRFDDTTEQSLSVGSASYTGFTPNNWFTPSAFCWGPSCDDSSLRVTSGDNVELPGIWVGKFETSAVDNVSSNQVKQPVIKPNLNSWRNININNAYESVLTYMNGSNGNNRYGLSGNYDSHVMKNTEWGVVAFLSQSKYGKFGNDNYIGANKEVAINNCVYYVTGIGGNTVSAASSTDCSNTYQTQLGQAASTTGNIYGIYDMSGGASEFMMANMLNSQNKFTSASSGMTTSPNQKHYNIYEYGTGSVDINRAILGDATSQLVTSTSTSVSSFYGDYRGFPREYNGSILPWFLRGGSVSENTRAGIFYHGIYNGGSTSTVGFRITISPNT